MLELIAAPIGNFQVNKTRFIWNSMKKNPPRFWAIYLQIGATNPI